MSQSIIDQMLVERSKLTRALKALGWEEFPSAEAKEAAEAPAPATQTAGMPKKRGAGDFWKSKKSEAARKAQSEKMKAVWAKRRRAAAKAK
jgi:hypothetical protein